MRRSTALVWMATAVLLTGCGVAGSPVPRASATPPLSASPSPAPASVRSESAVDLGELRESLLGPSPVPAEWQAEVDELMGIVEAALDQPLPAVGGLSAETAACATWQPLVGRLHWATGALLERQFIIAHLSQLAAVSPDAIRQPTEDALGIVSGAAAEQLSPDGDLVAISTAPRDEFRAIGTWALANCEIRVVAESDPNTEDWVEDDVEYSCDLDRSLLERGMEEFSNGPGEGRHAAHPHELEINLEHFVYPGWHRIASVDNDADPPTMEIEPIQDGFCDR